MCTFHVSVYALMPQHACEATGQLLELVLSFTWQLWGMSSGLLGGQEAPLPCQCAILLDPHCLVGKRCLYCSLIVSTTSRMNFQTYEACHTLPTIPYTNLQILPPFLP